MSDEEARYRPVCRCAVVFLEVLVDSSFIPQSSYTTAAHIIFVKVGFHLQKGTLFEQEKVNMLGQV